MDWSSILSMLGGLGQTGMGVYQGFGGGYNDPSKRASETLGQIPGQTQPYYSPYMDAGKGALSDLQNQNKDLLSGDTQNKLGANYKESPGYQFKLQQAMQAGNRNAAAGGMLGGGANQISNMQTAEGLANQDYNEYMQNQMNLYNTGYGGTQDINHMGFDANKGMADTIGNVTNQQANLQYAGDAGRNAYKGQGWSNASSGLGTIGAGPMGGQWAELMKYFGGHGQGV